MLIFFNKIESKRGFSLVEVLLTVSILVFILAALVGALIYARESSAISGARDRAVYLAEEGLEATRNIRDDDFSLLSDGNHGLVINSGEWRFSGSSDSTDVFTRQVNVSSNGGDRKIVTSTVTWDQNEQRQGMISLVTYLNNWKGVTVTPTCILYCQSLMYDSGTCRGTSVLCGVFGEVYESGGDTYCTGGAQFDTCCCAP